MECSFCFLLSSFSATVKDAFGYVRLAQFCNSHNKLVHHLIDIGDSGLRELDRVTYGLPTCEPTVTSISLFDTDS